MATDRRGPRRPATRRNSAIAVADAPRRGARPCAPTSVPSNTNTANADFDGDLPEGWTAARLADAADVQLGKMLDRAKRTRGSPYQYLRNANVRWGAFDLSDLFVMPFENHELDRYAVKSGDLLVCEGGEPGRAAIWNDRRTDIKYQKALLRVRPNERAIGAWILYALQLDALRGALEPHFTGSTIKHFPRQAALRYVLPLPPLAEQKRIVAKVEEVLASANAARDHLARVPALLKRFRQSVLAAACSGRLTEDWRYASSSDLQGRQASGDAVSDTNVELPPSWQWATARSLCDPTRALTYGVIKLGPPVAAGVPTLRSSDVRPLFIDVADVKRISPGIASNYRRTTLRGGEVLVTVRGTLGGVGVSTVDMANWNVSREVAVLPVLTERCRPRYLAAAIASTLCQNWLNERAKGVAYTGINIEDLKELPVPTPPVREQHEIVRRVDALFALADSIEQRVADAAARANALTQATLAKAFRGELVR